MMAEIGTDLFTFCDDKDSILRMDSCSSVVARDAGGRSSSSSSWIAIASPAKEKPLNGKIPVGNDEGIFFGSQGSLDSDCDDFFSVNGEFTPSRGGTPNYQKSAPSTPRPSKSLSIEKCVSSSCEPPPTGGRKKLGELLLETMREEEEEKLDLCAATHKDQQPSKRSLNGAPRSSEVSPFHSKGLTARKVHRSKKEKTWKMHERCLPSGGPMGLARSCRR